MPTPEEPGDTPAEPSGESEAGAVLSLVDYFDKIDRDAFRRALEYRDGSDPLTSRS